MRRDIVYYHAPGFCCFRRHAVLCPGEKCLRDTENDLREIAQSACTHTPCHGPRCKLIDTSDSAPTDSVNTDRSFHMAPRVHAILVIAHTDILVIAHKVRSWAGKGGRKYDAYNAEINKCVRERGITQEEAATEMEELEGKDRHAYNRSLDGKTHGGKGGSAYDAYNTEINKRVRGRGITKEEAAAEMEELEGEDRHEYNRLLDTKSWAAKGGSVYDAYNTEIDKSVRERGITKEEAATEMAELAGKDRHAYNRLLDTKVVAEQLGAIVQGANRDELHDMLITLMAKGDPYFDVDEWAHKVHAAVGSKDAQLHSKAAFRLETFEVQGGGTYSLPVSLFLWFSLCVSVLRLCELIGTHKHLH